MSSSAARIERPITPETPVQFLKGVGEARAAVLRAQGLSSVRDLLYFFPFRYEDRRHPGRIADLTAAQPVVLRGRVISAAAKTSPLRRMSIFEVILDDGSGTVMLVWFNQAYLAEQIRRGDRLAIYGQPRVSSRHGRLQIDSPDWEKLEDGEGEEEGTIVPIYSKAGNIFPRQLRRIVSSALDAAIGLEDPLPAWVRDRNHLIDLSTAILQLHQPRELDGKFLARRSDAHRRLIVQEFYSFQLAMRVRRATEEIHQRSRTIEITDAIRDEIRRVLPFRLTGAQRRVVKEIADDLRGGRPMYRLLQGDVGSGKTIVALIAAIVAIRNGFQVALLAPTEILVEQHYQRIRQLVDGSVRVARATGSMGVAERRTLLAALRDGYVELVVGTHALLEERVQFKSLGLAIVDEQHRFGVEQRQRLFEKGEVPDVLVMTATPIPRSLALAVYGDLELSVIDELPPGRPGIKTVVRGSAQFEKVFRFVEEQLVDGAQAFVVFPIIEESEKLPSLKPLTAGFEILSERFPHRRLAMLHGRMSAEEKEATMQSFKRGEVDILVATTVIEVGIDVPNASLMIVMDSDRFGLSQLHQLRGRVGRGERKSYCVLMRDEKASEEAKARLRLFETAKDGFDVAERDLQLRGAGDFLGTRQSGLPRFRFGDILRDHELMEEARALAIETIEREGLPAAGALARKLIGGIATDPVRD